MRTKEDKINPEEKEILSLIKDSLFKYKGKYLHVNDGCVYFPVNGYLYGYSQIKTDIDSDIGFIWYEDCDYTIEWNPQKQQNCLYKSFPEDYILLENDQLIELYTILNMEIKLQSEREQQI